MVDTLRSLLKKFFSTLADVLPIILVISIFQIFIIDKPFPNLKETLAGFALVVLDLGFDPSAPPSGLSFDQWLGLFRFRTLGDGWG